MSARAELLSFGSGRSVYSVADLTAELRGLIEGNFPSVRVSGEISNAKMHRSGHWYFTLKDESAQISCVCFRGRARFLRVKPAGGLEVIARGRVSVYPQQGRYQLYVEALELQGRGALQVQFERLKARLGADGLFDADRKRRLPPIPSRIGIVTSPTGAVIADMLRVIESRFPGLHIRLYPVRVQGEGAAEEIAAGVRYFGTRDWADVVIVGRGGGSLEDLWAFNDERVARAIAAAAMPVVSAVGHETDVTIADFVADVRAATPSVAAERAVPEAAGIRQALEGTEARVAKATTFLFARLRNVVLRNGMDRAALTVGRRVGDAGQRLDDAELALRATQAARVRAARIRFERAERNLAALDLRIRLARQSERLRSLAARLVPAMRRALDDRGSRLAAVPATSGILRGRLAREAERLAGPAARLPRSVRAALDRRTSRFGSALGRLHALSPLAILERGYSILHSGSGEAVRDSGQVSLGEALSVRLHRGRLGVRVENRAPKGGIRAPSAVDSL